MTPARSSSAFIAAARQHVRVAFALTLQRSPEATSRIVTDLTAVAAEARVLGHHVIAQLARRGYEQAKLLDRDPAAMTSLARALRELSRALDALEQTATSAHADAKRGKVLIIDDSVLNASVIRDALEAASFEAQCADCCDAAARAVVTFAPDVVLADVHMPDCTALELCTRLRMAAGGRPLHVLLFSALQDDELATLARSTRADGFVSKERGIGAVVEEVTRVCRMLHG